MRLIDADALEGRILMDAPGFMDGGSEITKAFILAMIKTRSVTPTVDAIPVVRCRDCKWWTITSPTFPIKGFCGCYHGEHDGDWFCADGVVKNNYSEFPNN